MEPINWNKHYAAIWRQQKEILRPVKNIDSICMEDLIDLENQKAALFENTKNFLHQHPANNALLWGAKGTGKSSLIKAIFNEFKLQGLRLIEVDKYDLVNLVEIVDEIRDLPQRFIIYCDDLSFDEQENSYKHLKSVLEGSIELPPENVLVYASSNRRHLMPEFMVDNLNTKLVDGELHYSDAVEEKTSLADRFGLWLSFYPNGWTEYFTIVDHYFGGYGGDVNTLHSAAKEFAMLRASKSGRTAKQFFNYYSRKT